MNGYRSHFGHVRKAPRTDECEFAGSTRKHRYLLPLTPGMKEIALKMRKPYPKRATSDTSDTPGVHPGKGWVARTVALPLPDKLMENSIPMEGLDATTDDTSLYTSRSRGFAKAKNPRPRLLFQHRRLR